MGKKPDKEIAEIGSWQISVLFSVIESFLLLQTAFMPQYGDSAIGTSFVGVLAFVLFGIQLFIITPIVLTRCTAFGHYISFKVFAPLLPGPAAFFIMLLIVNNRT